MHSSENSVTKQSRADPYSTNKVDICTSDAKHSGVYEPQRRIEENRTKNTFANVKNTSHQTEYFQEYSTNNYRVREAIQWANEPLPASPYGDHTMCYAFHVKGTCNRNCKNSGDHQAHKVQQDKLLLHWCLKNVKFRRDLTLEKPV